MSQQQHKVYDVTRKHLNDQIHGHIELSPLCVDVLDTPTFQRLRDLKQLGAAYYVYPGASHNRFEHCVGVSYLGGEWVERLRTSQPELDINERDVELVKLAGLCHDLGHGPFSHVFDSLFVPAARPDYQWKHEDGSEMLLDYLIDENQIDIDASDVRFVKRLIQGDSIGEKRFLFDIVANKRTGVDVDKFDYLSRDCVNVGIRTNYDSSRLLMFSRVIEDRIAFHVKEAFNLYELFHTRYSMFKRVYTHEVCKAIELMIVDAFLLADPVMKISSMIDDPEQFSLLTDCMLKEIERSVDPSLVAARNKIQDIRHRKLYRCVDQIRLNEATLPHGRKDWVTAERILSYSSTDDDHEAAPLTSDDIIVNWSKINYGIGNENPVDRCEFFTRWDQSQSQTVSREDVSLLLPATFQETSLRIFCRDPNKTFSLQRAFRRFCDASMPSEATLVTAALEEEMSDEDFFSGTVVGDGTQGKGSCFDCGSERSVVSEVAKRFFSSDAYTIPHSDSPRKRLRMRRIRSAN